MVTETSKMHTGRHVLHKLLFYRNFTKLLRISLFQMSNDVIHSMEDVLIKKYGVSQNNTDHRMVTDMWNFLQREVMFSLHCSLPEFRAFAGLRFFYA